MPIRRLLILGFVGLALGVACDDAAPGGTDPVGDAGDVPRDIGPDTALDADRPDDGDGDVGPSPLDLGPTVDVGPATDLGPLLDAGPSIDAEPLLDLGPPPDLGPPMDAGPAIDADLPLDRGPSLDAETSIDAEPLPDRDPPMDVGPTVDAQPLPDLGPPLDRGLPDPHACDLPQIGEVGVIEGEAAGESTAIGRCGGDGPEAVVDFVAPEEGRWRFDAVGSMGPVALHVRSTCRDPESELACGLPDDAAAYVELLLNPGQRVFVFVDGLDAPSPWSLTISRVVRDDCDPVECIEGEARCTERGRLQTCEDEDGDGCFEWMVPVVCGEDEICEDGACASCDGRDFENDPDNCGACGFVCAEQNAIARCAQGLCVLACDPGFGDCDGDPENGCETDVSGPDRCGSCAALAAPPGSPCGTCGTGVYVCNGPDAVICRGDAGIDATNACGGCGPLPFDVGGPCGACGSGQWGCDGEDRLRCVDDRGDAARNACGGCGALDAPVGDACGVCGDGVFECLGRDLVTCVGDTPANACGGCRPLANPPGGACGTCGLDRFVCGDDPDSTVCDGDTVDICGGCGDIDVGPEILGTVCGTCDTGRWFCADGRVACEGDLGPAAQNTCGGCTPLEQPVGAPCGPCLLDRYVCEGADAVVCDGHTACPDLECELQGDIGTRRITRAMSPCLVLADATLAEGDTLTIDAGVVLKFAVSTDWQDDTDLVINGDIQANGTDVSPIIFTSLRDDTAAGDINDDPDEELQPAPGDWGRLRFTGRGGGRLSNVHLRYGGGGNDGRCCGGARAAEATLEIESELAPTLEAIHVRRSQARGALIDVTGGFEWAIRGGVFVDNDGIGLEVVGERAPFAIADVQARGNVGDGIRLTSRGDQTLSGLMIESNGGHGVYIDAGGALDLSDSTISDHPNHFGLVVAAAAAESVVRGNLIEASDAVFAGDRAYVVSAIPNLVQEIAENNVLAQTARGFYVRGGGLTVDATWPDMGYAYVVTATADVQVDAGRTLTLEPGVVLKFSAIRDWQNDGDLSVRGRLDAVGTPDAPIALTSLDDDAWGGDTNGDGLASEPRPGDWGRLVFHPGSDGRLAHVNLHFGGGGNDGRCCGASVGADAALSVDDDTPPLLANLDIAYSQARGAHLRVTGGEDWGLVDSRIHHNATEGLRVEGENAEVSVSGTTIDANGTDGLHVITTGRISLTGLTVDGNGGDGVSVTTTGALEMRDNTISDHPAGVGLFVPNASAASRLDDNLIVGAQIAAKVAPDVIDPLTHGNDLRDTVRGIYILPGAVTGDAIWPADAFEYVIEYIADIAVAAGARLTLEPGLIVKVVPVRDWQNDADITVDGRLDAAGTPEAPIVFTSLYDDSLGGDTNGDDQDSVPAPGDWGRLRFTGAGTGVVEHVVLRFGGGGNDGRCCGAARGADAALSVATAVPPTMSHLAISQSQARGAHIGVSGGEEWALTASIFEQNVSHGLEVQGQNAPFSLDDVTAVDNRGHGIVLQSTGEQRLQDVVVRRNGGDGIHVTTTGPLLMQNTTIADHAAGTGLTVHAASPASRIDDNLIEGANIVARLAPDVVDAVTHGNQLRDTDRGIGVFGGTLTGVAVWPNLGIEYVLAGQADLTIAPAAHLTLEAGTVVKMTPVRDWQNDSDWIVDGRLDIVGTADDPIVFTSLWDDAIGGDTSGDGVATSAAPGDWGHVRFTAGAAGAVQHVTILHGGGGNDGRCCGAERAGEAALTVQAALPPAVDHVTVRESRGPGVAFAVDGGQAWSTGDLTIRDNQGEGLTITGGNAAVTVLDSEISANGEGGVRVATTGPVVFDDNRVVGNGGHGLSIGTTGPVSAHRNTLRDHIAGTGLVVTAAAHATSDLAGNTVAGNLRPLRTFPDLVEACIRNNDVRDVERGVAVDGGTLTTVSSWPPLAPYVLTGALTIAAEGHLTLEGGVLLKLAIARDWHDDLDIDVHGGLTTLGEDDGVRITALTDDLGGDTNGDGVVSLPAPGDWGRIIAREGSVLELAGAEIVYGGGGNDGRCCGASRPADATLSLGGGAATVRHSTIRASAGDGINITGGSGAVSGTALTDNAGQGLHIAPAVCADWAFADLVRMGNGEGDGLLLCP